MFVCVAIGLSMAPIVFLLHLHQLYGNARTCLLITLARFLALGQFTRSLSSQLDV